MSLESTIKYKNCIIIVEKAPALHGQRSTASSGCGGALCFLEGALDFEAADEVETGLLEDGDECDELETLVVDAGGFGGEDGELVKEGGLSEEGHALRDKAGISSGDDVSECEGPLLVDAPAVWVEGGRWRRGRGKREGRMRERIDKTNLQQPSGRVS